MIRAAEIYLLTALHVLHLTLWQVRYYILDTYVHHYVRAETYGSIAPVGIILRA